MSEAPPPERGSETKPSLDELVNWWRVTEASCRETAIGQGKREHDLLMQEADAIECCRIDVEYWLSSPAAETAERTAAPARLVSLAMDEARRRHLETADFYGYGTTDGHSGLFDDCPHADCAMVRHVPASPSPAPEGEPTQWSSQFFRACDRCITRTHCASQHRCLTECVPASPEPALREQIEALRGMPNEWLVGLTDREQKLCIVARDTAISEVLALLLSAAPAQGTQPK